MSKYLSPIRSGCLLAIILCMGFTAGAQQDRTEQELSGSGWSLWLDRGALWYNDSIHLPPVDVAKLPVNPPTGGWQRLHNSRGFAVSVPGTVEQHYWGAIGGAIPDTGGNYIGVSWWSRTFRVDPALKGKRITLCFQSVNLRAEVFVNEKLVGYDVVGNTPFEVDATNAIEFGGDNRLDIRITDPVGNFEWNDNILMRWGRNLVPAVHGFGGITGNVVLRATDAVNVSDIYVQNQPDPHKVKIFVTLENHSAAPRHGVLKITIHEKGAEGAAVWVKQEVVPAFSGTCTVMAEADVPAARLWELAVNKDIKQAAVYEAQVRYSGDDGSHDIAQQRFGFRWFDVEDRVKDHDPRFYLNGKRVFIIAAMTRGFWPTNGIFPTPAMAQRDLKTMEDLGMNMMLMHRAIGQPMVIEYADSSGLFTYEEPGGYRIMPNPNDSIDAPDDQARRWRREKLRRMILRDRSLPSMIIYNLKNEATIPPNEYDIADMKMVHELDPSRILTYNSGSDIGLAYHKVTRNNPFTLHMYPYNQQLLYDGWWDQHHWFGFSGYVDENYRNPRFYVRGVINSPRAPMLEDSLYRLDKREIIFFGEEGAFGTIVRLQKIKEELDTIGSAGFREKEHLDWYAYYDRFLDETGFRSSYPDVDSLTRSLGRNLHYFQARNIENVRMSNIADAYNMNGWGSAETRTDVVDMYRHPTADASIIRYYTRPLYVAVKLRNKVVPAGTAPVADFYIINELDLHGKYTLDITLSGPGAPAFHRETRVTVAGGETFGQLLTEGVQLPALTAAGYYTVHAELLGASPAAKGADDIYVVEENAHHGISSQCLILENDHIVRDYLKNEKGVEAGVYSPAAGRTDLIVIGNVPATMLDETTLHDLLHRAAGGTRIIVLEHADLFARAIDDLFRDRPPVYNGGGIINWAGSGRLFVGKDPMLEGLPQAQGMSWEYQCFYKTTDNGGNGLVSGLALDHARSEWVAALGSQRKKDILGALVRVPVGQGSVILSTLAILPNLSTQELSAVVAKRLFLNMLEQNPPAFANQSPRPPAQPGQEKHFLRAPEVLPGTLPEMRTPAYWTSRMADPDEVVMRVEQIRKMNMNFMERMRHPERIDSLARQLILAKIAAYPGLFFSEPDLFGEIPARRADIIRSTIEAEIKYMRHTEYGNILGIQYSAGELDRLEAEMSAGTAGDLPQVQQGMTVEAVDLRIVPLISPEYVGLGDKNRARWDVWSLDIVDIGTPVQILHVSKSGGFLFVLTRNGFGWLPAEKVAVAGRDAVDRYVTEQHFVVCTGDKVPFFAGPDGKFASGWLRMGDRVPLAGVPGQNTGGMGPYKIMVPVRQADGSLSVQAAWLAAGADVQVGYLPYTRRNVLLQSLKLLDNIYDWTGAWMGRNHATSLRDIFSCFGFRLPSCGELLSVYTDHPKWMSASTPRDRQYREVLANEPFLTLQICSSGHSQLFLGGYDGVPIVYDTHGYNYTDTASGESFDIRRECIETIALPDYFLKQDVVFVELK